MQDAAVNAPLTEGALAIGSTGVSVGELQEELHALSYTTGSEVGVFGPETRRAIMNFQEEHGLPITGIVDEATKVAIHTAREASPARPPNQPPTLPPGTPPLSQSRTIWGAMLAGLAALVEFVRATVTQFANLFPVVSTPYGRFNTIFILAAFIILGLGIVIYARIDDRRKKKR